MPFPYAWVKLNQSGDAERPVTPRAGHTLTPIRNAYVEGFFLCLGWILCGHRGTTVSSHGYPPLDDLGFPEMLGHLLGLQMC